MAAEDPDRPDQAESRERATGFPEPPGEDPGDRSRDPSPHHALNNPAREPAPTEWPDPYERREDPRDPPAPAQEPFGAEPHPPTAPTSSSDPHPAQDPEPERW